MAGYCASKAGVNALVEGLRPELGKANIHTTIICPGWIRTPLVAQIDVPHLYLMEVDYAARRIVEAIRRKRTFYAFPPAGAWRIRFLRWLPSGMGDWLAEYVIRSASPPR
jgi:NAD(P)-dependent dehydrogenase (short-subunit alcohol dehydrogenase family)